MEWQPIKSAPKDGTPVLLGFGPFGVTWSVVAHWSDGDWSLTGSNRHATRLHGRSLPTHYIALSSLPAIPKEQPE